MFLAKNAFLLPLLSLAIFVYSADNYSWNKRENKLEFENFSQNDEPLFLTPYIETGRIDEAQRLARVPPMLRGVESFAGFLTVNKTSFSNLFFWLFKSRRRDWETRPLVIFLIGGPGNSNAIGIFKLIGPFSVTKELRLRRRKYSWTRECNLVFFDAPVGSGFSFTKDDSGYAKDDDDVVRDLYEALIQLYNLFPSLRKNKLVVSGSSYGGRFVIALTHKIHEMNKVSEFRLNLSLMLIISGILDIKIVTYASHLYNLGLVDKKVRDKLMAAEWDMTASVRAGNYSTAFSEFGKIEKEVFKVIGFDGRQNFIRADWNIREPEYTFIQDSKTRRAIHVGNCSFGDDKEVKKRMAVSMMRSVKPEFQELLTMEEFPTLYVNGQLDTRVSYPNMVEYFASLEWPPAKDHYKAKRCQFLVDGKVAGYFKTSGLFTELLMRNSGHTVACDQPKWTFRAFDSFMTNRSSFVCN